MDLSVVKTVLGDFSDFTDNVSDVLGGWEGFFGWMRDALTFLSKNFLNKEQ